MFSLRDSAGEQKCEGPHDTLYQRSRLLGLPKVLPLLLKIPLELSAATLTHTLHSKTETAAPNNYNQGASFKSRSSQESLLLLGSL